MLHVFEEVQQGRYQMAATVNEAKGEDKRGGRKVCLVGPSKLVLVNNQTLDMDSGFCVFHFKKLFQLMALS